MSPVEYQARLDEILRYVAALLSRPAGTAEWEVGRTFALLADTERYRYIQSLMADHPVESRRWQIGWDLRAILLGWPEAEAVA
ncbi:hypothetical protein [Nocardia brasiliensis]|uniref:hypothetical protein n=1 Tax=Nocardia brasiliensis TaxID=37326 RepID=UPI002453B785|nr:hypothetical protein [Nocardia brasiliensis]